MTRHFDPAPAACRLAKLWNEQSVLPTLPEDERPITLAEGYAIQDALRIELKQGDVAGYKVAAANVAALRVSEFGEALFGYMPSTLVHADGFTVDRASASPYTLEVEVAFEIACDVNPSSEPLDIASMVSGAFLAIEVVRSRYTNRKVVGASSFVADDSAFHCFIKGPRLSDGQDASVWATAKADLVRDGQPITDALVGDDCTVPYDSLALFWQYAASYGITLKRGQLITTGTLLRPVDSIAAGQYEGRLGDARVRFSIA